MLTDKAKSFITKYPLGCIATVSLDGEPNVSPKATFVVVDSKTLIFADIVSPITVNNLKNNRKCSICFVDVFSRKGYKVIGDAEIFSIDTSSFINYKKYFEPRYEKYIPYIKNIIKINITNVKLVKSPIYSIEKLNENEVISRYKKTYINNLD